MKVSVSYAHSTDKGLDTSWHLYEYRIINKHWRRRVLKGCWHYADGRPDHQLGRSDWEICNNPKREHVHGMMQIVSE